MVPNEASVYESNVGTRDLHVPVHFVCVVFD
jgi:hypothetical protein